MSNSSLNNPQELAEIADSDAQMERGQLFVHDRLSRYASRINDLQAYAQVFLDTLIKHKLISEEEIESAFSEELIRIRTENRHLQPEIALRKDPPFSKQKDKVPMPNCKERIGICKAVCCKLDFALSAEEVESGKVRWDLGRPYFIRQNSEGYCCHNQGNEKKCGIYADRPRTCIQFNCTHDKRIWTDYEGMILNEKWIAENVQQHCGARPMLRTTES